MKPVIFSKRKEADANPPRGYIDIEDTILKNTSFSICLKSAGRYRIYNFEDIVIDTAPVYHGYICTLKSYRLDGVVHEEGNFYLPYFNPETGCQYYYNKSLKKNVYTRCQIEPEFPGGDAAYNRFLNKNLIIQDSIDDVTALQIPKMSFIIDTDGSILNPSIEGKSDKEPLNAIEKAALKLIVRMPKWIPGKCDGRTVAVEMTLPLANCILWHTE